MGEQRRARHCQAEWKRCSCVFQCSISSGVQGTAEALMYKTRRREKEAEGMCSRWLFLCTLIENQQQDGRRSPQNLPNWGLPGRCVTCEAISSSLLYTLKISPAARVRGINHPWRNISTPHCQILRYATVISVCSGPHLLSLCFYNRSIC